MKKGRAKLKPNNSSWRFVATLPEFGYSPTLLAFPKRISNNLLDWHCSPFSPGPLKQLCIKHLAGSSQLSVIARPVLHEQRRSWGLTKMLGCPPKPCCALSLALRSRYARQRL